MKKTIKNYLVMFSMLLFATLAVTSCSEDKDEPVVPSDSPAARLIGTWVSEASYESITLTFNANGTGTEIYEDEDGTESEDFTWTDTETRLTIKYDGDDEKYTSSYSISNDNSTLVIDGETFLKR